MTQAAIIEKKRQLGLQDDNLDGMSEHGVHEDEMDIEHQRAGANANFTVNGQSSPLAWSSKSTDELLGRVGGGYGVKSDDQSSCDENNGGDSDQFNRNRDARIASVSGVSLHSMSRKRSDHAGGEGLELTELNDTAAAAASVQEMDNHSSWKGTDRRVAPMG